MNLLQNIKNIFAKKQNITDNHQELPTVIIDKEPRKIYSLDLLVNLTYDRNGYQREFALKQLLSNFPHHQETLNVLLRLQNDYVEVIRTLAYENLLLWINADNLPLLLENTHKFYIYKINLAQKQILLTSCKLFILIKTINKKFLIFLKNIKEKRFEPFFY